MTIIKVEYDTEDPLCSIVKNIRIQAKEEVFDEDNLDKAFIEYKSKLGDKATVKGFWRYYKKRHLSTLPRGKAT